LRRCEIGDDQHLARVTSFRLAERSPAQSVFAVLWEAHSFKEHYAITVRVRVTVSKVHLIRLVRKLNHKGERVESLSGSNGSLFALEVAYLSARSVPADVFVLCSLLRVDQWLHAVVVERVGLNQVNDVEFIGVRLLCV